MLSGGTILEYLSEMNILGDMVVQWIEALRQEGPGLLTKFSLCVIERCVCPVMGWRHLQSVFVPLPR